MKAVLFWSNLLAFLAGLIVGCIGALAIMLSMGLFGH